MSSFTYDKRPLQGASAADVRAQLVASATPDVMKDDPALADSLNGSVTYEINISSTPNLLLYSMQNDQVITSFLCWLQTQVAVDSRCLQCVWPTQSGYGATYTEGIECIICRVHNLHQTSIWHTSQADIPRGSTNYFVGTFQAAALSASMTCAATHNLRLHVATLHRIASCTHDKCLMSGLIYRA